MKGSKTLSIFLVCILMASFCLIIFSHFVSAAGENWLTGWLCRKSHTIGSATGADVNYQFQVTVYYSSGSDSSAAVYLSNNSRSDFGDVRWTASDGSTLLDYYIESKTDLVSAVMWVEVSANLTSAGTTIYIYYGNPSATSISSKDNTFIFYDDFSSNSLNSTLWGAGTARNGATYTAASGYLSVSMSPVLSKYWGQSFYTKSSGWNPNNTAVFLYSSKTGHYASAWNTRIFLTDPTGMTWAADRGEPNSNSLMLMSAANSGASDIKGVNGDAAYAAITVRVWIQKVNTTHLVLNSTVLTGTANPSNYATITVAMATNVYSDYEVCMTAADYSQSTTVLDNVIIRRWVSPEPAQTTWGTEESYYIINLIGSSPAAEINTNIVLYSNWTVPVHPLSNYTFSINTGAGYSNTSWSPTLGSTWANYTYSISSEIGTVIYWKVYVNFTSGVQQVSLEQSFTVQATLVFYHNEGGTFSVNGEILANGTIRIYNTLDPQLFLVGAVDQEISIWQRFNWTSGSSIVNGYTYNVTVTDTLWSIFGEAGSGQTIIGISDTDMVMYVAVGSMIAGLLAVVIVFFWIKRPPS